MKRLVGCFLVLLGFYIQTISCDVLVTSANEDEGSPCYLRNRTRGICRDFCNDPGQNWIEFKDDICNPRKRPTLYCCVDKPAANLYPTLYDVCMKTVLAESMEMRRKSWYSTTRNAVDWYEEQMKLRKGVITANCNRTARHFEEDEEEKNYFLANCLKVDEVATATVSPSGEFRRLEYSSMVGIGWIYDEGVSWICTGHFIHPLFVLTSAHCIAEPPSQNHSYHTKYPNAIRYGRVDLSDEEFSRGDYESYAFIIPIEEIIVLEQYNKETLAGDIALLKAPRILEDAAEDAIHLLHIPACLWTKADIPAENLNVVAYGNILHKGNVSSINPNECAKKLSIDELDEKRACYACNFGNEAPMVASLYYSENLKVNVPYLVGIGSSKMPCRGDEPAHFTLIYPYLRQIEEIISDDY